MLRWFEEGGNNSDVVISSRVRLARNINGYNFSYKMSDTDSKKLVKNVTEQLKTVSPINSYNSYNFDYLDAYQKMGMRERHVISSYLEKQDYAAGFVAPDEEVSIMINEEDHIRIQVFASGLELDNSLNLANEIEKGMGNLINYAFSEKYGYLTENMTNVGTGLRASVMVHLPALTATRNIDKVLDVVNGFGMNIRGLYGDGSETQGNVYQISNKQSLGISDKEIINNLKLITSKIIEQERMARKYLAKKSMELEDRVYRAYGILSNCRKVSANEAKKLISDVKLGTDLGIIKEMNDLKVNKLDLYTKSASLQLFIGQTLNENEREIARAETIKKILAEN